ncbi:uncharacterized protein TNCV_2868221 [Trichonephila clavipes]|nr:uncharacterized protein TNCV_2868221 [Trichonephila clavipes]
MNTTANVYQDIFLETPAKPLNVNLLNGSKWTFQQMLKKIKLKGKRPELGRDGGLLHQDSTPDYMALFVKQFLTSKNITVIENAPIPPDLASCAFILSPTIKTYLKGTHSTSVEEVQAKTENSLKGLPNTLFQNCFQQ